MEEYSSIWSNLGEESVIQRISLSVLALCLVILMLAIVLLPGACRNFSPGSLALNLLLSWKTLAI